MENKFWKNREKQLLKENAEFKAKLQKLFTVESKKILLKQIKIENVK